MRILTYSRAFLPLVGGLQINIHNLCSAWSRLGHEVVVATVTPGQGADEPPYRVVRNPGPLAMLRLVRWCDVFHHANVSLHGWWPLLFVRRPWVASHHGTYRRPDGRIGRQDRLKRWLLRFATGSIAVSKAVADDLPLPAAVIENAYRNELFRVLPGVPRERDLIFVGRLVSDKGADVLIESLALLAAEGLRPGLSVVGDGPERAALEEQARGLGLEGQVRFAGTVTGEALVELLNRHRILVVPSRREPFGTVALEGIACGCAVVASDADGLPEAVGPCGVSFPSGDCRALADAVAGLLGDPARARLLLAPAASHLEKHATAAVAWEYLEVFRGALARRRL